MPVDQQRTVETVSGVDVGVLCASSTQAGVTVAASPSSGDLNFSGTGSSDSTLVPVNVDGGVDTGSRTGSTVDLDGVASNTSVGRFARLDVHATASASGCPFWGVLTPAQEETP